MNKVALWLLVVLVGVDAAGTWATYTRAGRQSPAAAGREEAKAIADLGSKLIAECGGDLREAYRRKALASEAAMERANRARDAILAMP